ncbi:NmrA family NAD(P)-binding protein [Flavitalea sp. BT771]|uniref:SDR family oxidoreductase n=1 Tax=Flavitalea sp. BT771 TaxID=3063329 RepID=UPI0026E40C8B|nr:NmrA family NAD(P)-binding protein [Flavitalea sp. BT771]MDO6429998.1 NmrA family NAD(P)-binding protein [Flavitalea sp. BT771]MDV6217874.1 NmrA family NAD(P)-binding protein [Flavitalea sp. BT771]
MKLLMIGATGRFAGLVLPQLKKQGHHITALVQDGNKGKQAIASGADQFAIGDLYDPVTLKSAAAGIDGVFHIIPAFNREVEAGLNMVKAAEGTGVKKFVFSSVYHTSLSLANHAEKRPTEEALYHSGMDYTILQPAMYMQMLQQSWQAAKQSGEIVMPYSKDSKMAYVDYRDVAEAVALAMTDRRLSYGTFELASPGMFSRVDLAELMSKKLGKRIIAKDLPVDEWAKQVNIPPGELREGLISMNKEYDKYGFSGGNALVLETILGHPARTVPQFIEELK